MAQSDVDRSASPTLRTRSAGQLVMQKCLTLQDEAPPRGRIARALGHSPLHPDAVSWYDDALAELETGRRLATLGAGYTVLHSLPIGDGEGALRADVEHLVIGPAGIFCLNSTQSVTDAQLEELAVEARQVSKHLSRTLQRVVPVTPLLVSLGAGESKTASPAGRARPRDVEVVPSRALAGWFASRGPVLTTAELVTLALAAEQPGTWHAPAALLEHPVVADEFLELQSAVDAATDRERVALAVAVTVTVIVVLVSAAVIVTSVVPGFLQLTAF